MLTCTRKAACVGVRMTPISLSTPASSEAPTLQSSTPPYSSSARTTALVPIYLCRGWMMGAPRRHNRAGCWAAPMVWVTSVSDERNPKEECFGNSIYAAHRSLLNSSHHSPLYQNGRSAYCIRQLYTADPLAHDVTSNVIQQVSGELITSFEEQG